MTQRLIDRAGTYLDRATSRRGFLMRVAAVGAAASLNPLRTLISPTPAWAAFGDGFTEFCCSVVGGNYCPSFTFIGGYWKCTLPYYGATAPAVGGFQP